jgi:hypothetical protein
LELSLEWLCRALRGGEGAGELPDVVDVGVPPVSLLLLLSVVADEGRPTYKTRTGLLSYSSINIIVLINKITCRKMRNINILRKLYENKTNGILS